MQIARRVATEEWLQDVQRDPRTVGAFRRRIEMLLCDPAVARRVASRVGTRADLGLASPPEPLDLPATPRSVATPRPAANVVHALSAEPVRERSIIGSCRCDGNCCMMVPYLREMRAVFPEVGVAARS